VGWEIPISPECLQKILQLKQTPTKQKANPKRKQEAIQTSRAEVLIRNLRYWRAFGLTIIIRQIRLMNRVKS
jgi:hypothetical protein